MKSLIPPLIEPASGPPNPPWPIDAAAAAAEPREELDEEERLELLELLELALAALEEELPPNRLDAPLKLDIPLAAPPADEDPPLAAMEDESPTLALAL